jgi:uncharacterized protein YjdB
VTYVAGGALATPAAACGDYIIPEPTVDGVEIVAPRVSLAVGDSLTLRATVYGARDRAFVGSTKVVVAWQSAAPEVAVVNASTGVVRGIAPGRATVRALVRSKRDSVTVSVTAPVAP